MGYMCENCGNNSSFSATQNYTEWGTEDITINGEGEVIDWNDRNVNDSEIREGPNEIECNDCGSGNVTLYDDEDEEAERLEEIRQENGEEEVKPKPANGRELLGE